MLNEAILVLVRTVSTEFVAKAPDLASTWCLLSLVVGRPAADWAPRGLEAQPRTSLRNKGKKRRKSLSAEIIKV